MLAKCHYCKVYDVREGGYLYHMAKMTDWYPPSGYDPNLRQFRCKECGKIFYELLTDEEIVRAEAPV
jgi:hypothetical protein